MFAELVSLGAAPGRGEAPSVGAGSVHHALGYKMFISNTTQSFQYRLLCAAPCLVDEGELAGGGAGGGGGRGGGGGGAGRHRARARVAVAPVTVHVVAVPQIFLCEKKYFH